MVQLLLGRVGVRGIGAAGCAIAAIALSCSLSAAPKTTAPIQEHWQLALDGGRSLTWERSFQAENEVKPSRGFWNKLVDMVAGAPDNDFLVRPYSVVTDSHGRIIVTDPGAKGVHIFDFAGHKYKFLQHEARNYSMRAPQCVAVDAADNIYVTDSEVGVIFVFEPGGKFLRTIGAIKGGEGYFKRPTGIAVDSAAQQIFVTDTLRDQIFVLDMQGNILKTIGQHGDLKGEFNFPTELRFDGPNLLVVDAMNFRVQAFDRAGNFQFSLGILGDGAGAMFRPKAISVDSEGDIYVVDGLWGMVQVFNRQGQLLYYFGKQGTQAGEFQLPSGLFIDRSDHVYVVDSFNRRVQVFQYSGLKQNPAEAIK